MMLDSFDSMPRTRLVFGAGTLDRLGHLSAELGAHRVLLVTDRGIVAAGHAGRAVALLKAAGLEVAVYDAVRENPTTLDVARCVEGARAAGADLFVGIGGGSSMDTAKGANFLLTNGGEIRDYQGVGRARHPMLPLIAIPTTAGTGSECQSAALIADEATHVKMACLDPKAAARIAILDPVLTVSQPRRVTALTGTDALVHAVESAVTSRRTPWSFLHSREAFRLCAGALETVLAEPENLEARGRMLLGAALAGMAIENSMLGAAHAAANPLTAHFGVVHGAAVGLLLPHVVRYNAIEPSAQAGYFDLAVSAGLAGPGTNPEAAVAVLIGFLQRLQAVAGIPGTLAAAGVDPAAIPELAADAARQWTAGFNPRPIGQAGFEALYRKAAEAPGHGPEGF
jgi:alcohol dehydrogenase